MDISKVVAGQPKEGRLQRKERSKEPMQLHNPYMPDLATIIDMIEETPNDKDHRVTFDDRERMDAFGSSRDRSASSPSSAWAKRPLSSIRLPRGGLPPVQRHEGRGVTTAIHDLRKGDKIGVRAPFGNISPTNR